MNHLSRLTAGIQLGLILLVTIMPFHAFLVVWAGSILGHETILQAWKEIVLVILLAMTIALAVREPMLLRRMGRLIPILIAAFIVVSLIVTVAARPSASAALYGAKTDLEFLVAFMIAAMVMTRQLLARLATITITTGVIAAAVGLALVTVLPHDLLRHVGYGPGTILPFERVDPVIAAIRTPSTLGGPNQFGAFLILPLCLALARFMRRRFWYGAAVLTMGAGVFVSYSRAAFVGSVVGVVAVIILSLPRKRALYAAALAALVLVVSGSLIMTATNAGTKLQYYVLHENPKVPGNASSTSQHVSAFQNGLSDIAAHPLGQGLGTAGPASYHSSRPFIPESYYLQIGVETGIAGLALFVALIVVVLMRLLRQRQGEAIALASALLGVSIVCLALHGWADSTLALVFWILAGGTLGTLSPSDAPIASTQLLGVRLDSVTMEEALDHIATMIERRTPGLIATVNAEFIVTAQSNTHFRRVLNESALALPDGSGPTILSRLLGQRLKERITGVDLTERLMERASRRGWRVFLLGGTSGVTKEVSDIWQRRYSGLIIAGCNEGSKEEEAAPVIVRAIKRSRADIVLVAFAYPRQEEWIAEHLIETGASVGIGTGGTFNYVAGRVKRAPKLWRRLGLEWLYRLIREPWRARRMLAIPKLVLLTLRYGSKPSH